MDLAPGTTFELEQPEVTYSYSRRRLALEACVHLGGILLLAALGLVLGLLMHGCGASAGKPLVRRGGAA
ncbi:MAG TPA: hypothetical protein VIO14_00525 [Dehalococcoidia bacterium]